MNIGFYIKMQIVLLKSRNVEILPLLFGWSVEPSADVVISLLIIRSRGQPATLPPTRSPFFRTSALSLSLLPSLLCVVMVIKAKGGGGGIEAVAGLVVGWELGMVKWSDLCTHKQCVRWSRREVGGRGERERERGKDEEKREGPWG